MTNRTEQYYMTAKNHREKLKLIWQTYETEVAALEKHQGSQYYDEEIKKAAEKRDTAIAATKDATATAFNEILLGMRESAVNRPMATPTDAELALLSALKMRERISRQEIEQAARTLKNSPVCLSVLQEIAEKQQFFGMRLAAESTSSILEHVESLEKAARKLLKLEKPDSRREQIAQADIHSPNYSSSALETLLVDRDFNDEDSMLSFFGNLADAAQFREAVNG